MPRVRWANEHGGALTTTLEFERPVRRVAWANEHGEPLGRARRIPTRQEERARRAAARVRRILRARRGEDDRMAALFGSDARSVRFSRFRQVR